ncbi:TetR family transcriptional regulator [Psychrobacillus insolitus]|uniref:TetR family transcriptional regulator n=1 Tax=Psychrobacillus insolitus TaxID=1461 RepID=A0A2W7MN49_9BACI|nr:TetR/AcrR family transcriptional regulator [Psychrobacillus insolitus]PZX08305.1 TetR family transcriptional regulator [Psychrobacillus insolitus]
MKLSEKKIQKKKEDIILSAVKIVNEKGYQKATMEEIAAELLMTKGSLYYYFKNKEDLIFQCHEMVLVQAIEELQQHINVKQSNEEKLREMIKTHIQYAIEKKEMFNMIIKPDQTFSEDQLNPILLKRNEYAGLFDQVILAGIKTAEFTIDEPKIARMILLGSMNWIQQWYNPFGSKTIEELQQIYADYMLKVLK